MPVQSLGNPQITGRTVDELRKSTQFWLQQAFNHLDSLTGVRGTPKFFSPVDAQGHTIKNIGAAVDPGDAVPRAQTIVLETPVGVSATPQFNAQGVGIVNLPAGIVATDAVNVTQLQDTVATSISVATSGLVFTRLATGFTILGGTTSKTLTVDLDLTASTSITVAGTANRITTSGSTTLSAGGTVSTVDISASYVGQTSITTLGTITTGVWNGTAITVAFGGTGIVSYAVGDLLYASGVTTLSRLADVAAGAYLRSGGVATAPVWSTTTLPNSAVVGDLLSVSASNVYANITAVATGSVLASAGVATLPVWTTGPVVTSLTSSAGTGTGTILTSGRIDTQTSAAGIGNGADATDDTLFTYSLPLNSLTANGKTVRGVAYGHFATNGNNKRVKFFFAGAAVADSAVVTSNNLDWDCQIEIIRIDATHVSARGIFTVSGTASVITVTPNLVVSDLTANASIVKITGASPTSSAANDVLGYAMNTTFLN